MIVDHIATEAENQILELYWRLCDGKKAAVDPSELTKIDWVEELLDEQFEIALRCESDPEGWDLARQKW